MLRTFLIFKVRKGPKDEGMSAIDVRHDVGLKMRVEVQKK